MKEENKMVYLLPNLMTAGNLFFGFTAILNIFEGTIHRTAEAGDWTQYYQFSLYCIIGAFICDMLDGRLARLGGTESPFGREFDSLADIVSFGLAPALLMFKIVLSEMPNRIGWPIAFIYLACGALRLARFNVLSANPDKKSLQDFTGFPIPAAAGLIASITLVLLNIYGQEREIGAWKYFLAALMLFLSYMMFSKVRYPSFKALDWRAQMSVPRLLAYVVVIGVVLIFYRYALAVLFAGYLFYGFARPYISKSWRQDLGDEEEDECKPGS
ncbi:MAG: CDP-diacylglycerol--serine O-phosphatidyltransferase [Verrucomicrobiales bacterium]|jgi:CDP-diacylglycerol--serine O-phosphatidyltransferase|nr:CDP-diacylglycerol--serine O-phosphatidyltransferase [Verrucomicrobiales bacterium]